jgi:hypothetical protein
LVSSIIFAYIQRVCYQHKGSEISCKNPEKKMQNNHSKEIESLLLRLDAKNLELATAVMETIRACEPSLTEKVKWGRITYSMGEADIAFLCCHPAHAYIEVGFFKGKYLFDPGQLLSGKGNEIRRAKIKTLDEKMLLQVEAWVKEAVGKAP